MNQIIKRSLKVFNCNFLHTLLLLLYKNHDDTLFLLNIFELLKYEYDNEPSILVKVDKDIIL